MFACVAGGLSSMVFGAESTLVYKYKMTTTEIRTDAYRETNEFTTSRRRGFVVIETDEKGCVAAKMITLGKSDSGERSIITENLKIDAVFDAGLNNSCRILLGSEGEGEFDFCFTNLVGTLKPTRGSTVSGFTLPQRLDGVLFARKHLPGKRESSVNGPIAMSLDRRFTERLRDENVTNAEEAADYVASSFVLSNYVILNPKAVNDSVALDEEIIAAKTVDIDVLANDSDPGGSAIAINRLISTPSFGTATILNDSQIKYAVTAWDGFTGVSFDYEIINAEGAVGWARVTISGDKPIAVADVAYTVKNVGVEIDVLANDTDPHGSSIELLDVSTPSGGTATVTGASVVTYTPMEDFVGVDTFDYQIDNEYGKSARGRVTVCVDQPMAIDDETIVPKNDSATLNVLANDEDPCDLPLVIVGFTSPEHGTVEELNGKLVYTPVTDYLGMDSFSYTAGNGHGAESAATVTITVEDRPEAGADVAYTTKGRSVTIDPLANDTDPDGTTLTIGEISSPSHGSATMSGNAIVYVPAAAFLGVDTFSYTAVNTAGKTGTGVVTVYVDEPVAIDDTASVRVNQTVVIDVLANDSDPAGLPLIIERFDAPFFGTLSQSDDQTLVYTPDEDYSGSDRFSYACGNGHGASAEADVHITISAHPAPQVWELQGDDATDNFGYTVHCQGDVNGDGYDDLLTASPHWDGDGFAYCFLGSEKGISSNADWSYAFDGGSFPGFINYAGDVNGDGYDDVIIGAPLHDGAAGTEAGRVVVFHGSASGLPDAPNWTFDHTNANARFGRSVSSAGDVNGDGYDDVIIGAPWDHDYAGGATVFLGSETGLSPTPDWTVTGPGEASQFGFALAHADVDGDGYSDVIVTAKDHSNGENAEGAAYVFAGSSTGLSSDPAWTGESDVNGAEYGYSVSCGDLNGDAHPDLIVGAWLCGISAASQGCSFIYYGNGTGFSSEADLILKGDQKGSFFGFSAACGDIDGDGADDLVIGAPAHSAFFGKISVYNGAESGLNTTAGRVETGDAEGDFGYAVSLGDLNGDGHIDVVASSPYRDANGDQSGQINIFYANFAKNAARPVFEP